MNFFAQQQRARTLTFRLILLLCLAVICLIIMTTIVLSTLLYFFQSHVTSIHAVAAYSQSYQEHFVQLIQSSYFVWIIATITLVITIGSFYKYLQLQRGGEYIALTLGGCLINADTQNIDEKRLLHVVEEMAIAAGMPLPKVYILPEQGINAFAAGNDWQKAVIGITQGCIETLSRDELQGIVAHEFSHIFNGDMRLNLRLIAILHGILLIGLCGEFILHSSSRCILVTSTRKNKRKQLFFLGTGLVVIGYAGVFFGNLIKAAVSRQREFLADASAVQYTRNPLGIGSALNRITTHHNHSEITHPKTAQFTHMYFAEGIIHNFLHVFATHPPINDRLKRIFPSGIPDFNQKHKTTKTKQQEKQTSKTDKLKQSSSFITTLTPEITPTNTDNKKTEASHTQNNLSYTLTNTSAIQAWKNLPDSLLQAARHAFSARAIIYGLLLNKELETKEQQIHYLKKSAHPRTYHVFTQIVDQLNSLTANQFLPLLEICLNSLKELSKPQQNVFLKNIRQLINSDKKIYIFEWCIHQRVNLLFSTPKNTENKTLNQCQHHICLMLKAVAQATQIQSRELAIKKGMLLLWEDERCYEKNITLTFDLLSTALDTVSQLKPLAKPQLLQAVKLVIEFDEKTTHKEQLLFSLIATTLNAPSTI